MMLRFIRSGDWTMRERTRPMLSVRASISTWMASWGVHQYRDTLVQWGYCEKYVLCVGCAYSFPLWELWCSLRGPVVSPCMTSNRQWFVHSLFVISRRPVRLQPFLLCHMELSILLCRVIVRDVLYSNQSLFCFDTLVDCPVSFFCHCGGLVPQSGDKALALFWEFDEVDKSWEDRTGSVWFWECKIFCVEIHDLGCASESLSVNVCQETKS